jgi:hypothetical protein
MKKQKQEYQLRSDSLIIGNWKFTSNGFIYVEGEKDMKYEELIKEIKRKITDNKNSINDTTSYKPYEIRFILHDNNILLEKIEDILKNADKEYERGCEDAWELARKVVDFPSCGGYWDRELNNIFGVGYSYREVLRECSAKEALAKIEAYEQKKIEEAEKQKIKLGDVVVNEAWNIPFMVTELDLNDGWIRGYDGDGQPHKFIWPNNCIHKVGKASNLFRLGKALSDGKDTESV